MDVDGGECVDEDVLFKDHEARPGEPKRRRGCWFRHHAEATLLATFVRSFAAESHQRKGEFDAVVKALLALAVAPDRLRMLLDSQPGMMAGHALCSTAAALLDRLAASPNMSTAYGAWRSIRRTVERPAHPTFCPPAHSTELRRTKAAVAALAAGAAAEEEPEVLVVAEFDDSDDDSAHHLPKRMRV